jgi:hypothetical protein
MPRLNERRDDVGCPCSDSGSRRRGERSHRACVQSRRACAAPGRYGFIVYPGRRQPIQARPVVSSSSPWRQHPVNRESNSFEGSASGIHVRLSYRSVARPNVLLGPAATPSSPSTISTGTGVPTETQRAKCAAPRRGCPQRGRLPGRSVPSGIHQMGIIGNRKRCRGKGEAGGNKPTLAWEFLCFFEYPFFEYPLTAYFGPLYRPSVSLRRVRGSVLARRSSSGWRRRSTRPHFQPARGDGAAGAGPFNPPFHRGSGTNHPAGSGPGRLVWISCGYLVGNCDRTWTKRSDFGLRGRCPSPTLWQRKIGGTLQTRPRPRRAPTGLPGRTGREESV